MRHLNSGRKLNRTSAHRKALMRNLVLSLIQYGRLKTTDAKAKELRRWADRMVTLGKRGDLAAHRRAYAFLGSHSAVKKLFDDIAPRFKERPAATPGSSSMVFAAATPHRSRSSSSRGLRRRPRRARSGAERSRASISTANAAPQPPRVEIPRTRIIAESSTLRPVAARGRVQNGDRAKDDLPLFLRACQTKPVPFWTLSLL